VAGEGCRYTRPTRHTGLRLPSPTQSGKPPPTTAEHKALPGGASPHTALRISPHDTESRPQQNETSARLKKPNADPGSEAPLAGPAKPFVSSHDPESRTRRNETPVRLRKPHSDREANRRSGWPASHLSHPTIPNLAHFEMRHRRDRAVPMVLPSPSWLGPRPHPTNNLVARAKFSPDDPPSPAWRNETEMRLNPYRYGVTCCRHCGASLAATAQQRRPVLTQCPDGAPENPVPPARSPPGAAPAPPSPAPALPRSSPRPEPPGPAAYWMRAAATIHQRAHPVSLKCHTSEAGPCESRERASTCNTRTPYACVGGGWYKLRSHTDYWSIWRHAVGMVSSDLAGRCALGRCVYRWAHRPA
jgi:hypothetical protein